MAQQMFSLRPYQHLIENIRHVRGRENVSFDIWLQPSEESRKYKVHISYGLGKTPKVWLVEPTIENAEGKRAHHVYWDDCDKNGNPRLCVFFPREDEWNANSLIGRVFIPWVISWLYAYEYWLLTGIWHYAESRDVKKTVMKKLVD